MQDLDPRTTGFVESLADSGVAMTWVLPPARLRLRRIGLRMERQHVEFMLDTNFQATEFDEQKQFESLGARER